MLSISRMSITNLSRLLCLPVALSHHLHVNTAISNEGFTQRREFLTSVVTEGPRSTVSYNTLEKNDKIVDSVSRAMLCLVAKCSWLKSGLFLWKTGEFTLQESVLLDKCLLKTE